jgi:hypothetical protein
MPRIYRVHIFLVGLTLLSAVATEVRANSVTIFDNRNAFIAASTIASTVTFEGITPIDTSIGYGIPGSVTLGGVTFQSGPSVQLALVNFSDTFFHV